MPYRLRENLSYCQVDGCLIFLDIEEDRYFRLPSRLEAIFLGFLQGVDQHGADVNELVRRHILTLDAGHGSGAPAIVTPSCSALEHKSKAPAPHGVALLEVFPIVCSTQLQLKTRRIRHIIANLVAYRRRRTAFSQPTRNASPTAPLLEAVGTFRRSRPYVPIETCCLLDSLALVRFLARRHYFVKLVFGVTHNPFAAHCWVQSGDWVLNDTVGNVAAHTPIREV